MTGFPREIFADARDKNDYIAPPMDDESGDYVKWKDLAPDEDSAMALILSGINDGTDTIVSVDSTNVETGESNVRS